MVRKKKPYRYVRDKDFLTIADMPLMQDRKQAIEWTKNSDVIEYIFHQVRNWGFVVSVQFEDGDHGWQGINCIEGKRNFHQEAKTSYGRKVLDALIKDEIDLMPLLIHRYFKEPYYRQNSEVIEYLKTKKNILNLAFVTAAYNGHIIRNEDGSWIGKKHLEGGER